MEQLWPDFSIPDTCLCGRDSFPSKPHTKLAPLRSLSLSLLLSLSLSRWARTLPTCIPFICTQCKYSCKQTGTLKRHMLTHSEERPFNCSQCNQAFKRSSELKQHILIHTGKKPHVCDLCNFSSANASNFNVTLGLSSLHT